MSGSPRRLSDKMGFTHFIETEELDAIGLARLIQFIVGVTLRAKIAQTD